MASSAYVSGTGSEPGAESVAEITGLADVASRPQSSGNTTLRE